MSTDSYPKKATVITVGIPADIKHTWLPANHPFDIGDGGQLIPAKARPGIRVEVNKPTEIDISDERHEALLRTNHQLKFLEQAKDSPPKDEKPNGAPAEVVQAEAPAEPNAKPQKGGGRR